MGFSIIGFCIALTILAPNLLMIVLPPQNMPAGLGDAGVVFTIFERVGQVCCLTLLVFSKSNFQNRSPNAWFVLSVVFIALYYALWIRYVAMGRDFTLLFTPVIVPIPMAVLPVLAFGFIAVWSKSVWLGAADLLFAIGHIANSWHTYIHY